MGLVLQETCCSSQVLKTWRLVQETNEEKLFIKSRQITRQKPAVDTTFCTPYDSGPRSLISFSFTVSHQLWRQPCLTVKQGLRTRCHWLKYFLVIQENESAVSAKSLAKKGLVLKTNISIHTNFEGYITTCNFFFWVNGRLCVGSLFIVIG